MRMRCCFALAHGPEKIVWCTGGAFGVCCCVVWTPEWAKGSGAGSEGRGGCRAVLRGPVYACESLFVWLVRFP